MKSAVQFRKSGFPLILYAMLYAGVWCAPGCAGKVALTDLPESAVALQLTQGQQEVIVPRIQQLRDVVEDYEFEKQELEVDYQRYRNIQTAYQTGRYEGNIPNLDAQRERNQLRTKLRSFVQHRREHAREIDALVKEIKTHLTPEQLFVFETLKLPELELPDALRRIADDQFMLIPGQRGARPDDF
jgi:hypothetical protein